MNVTGVHLYVETDAHGHDLCVAVEYRGRWYEVIRELAVGMVSPVSHICEEQGMSNAVDNDPGSVGPKLYTEQEAIALAVKVATDYAYDHEHKGPEENELRERLVHMAEGAVEQLGHERRARTTLEQQGAIEADPLCQVPGCYHPKSAHTPAAGSTSAACWRSGCACANYLGS